MGKINNRARFERQAFNQCLKDMKIEKWFDDMCEKDKALFKERIKNTFRYQMLILNYNLSDIGRVFKMTFEDIASSFFRGFEKGKK